MRRMITEKEADKLRFLNNDDGSIALASGDPNDDAKITLDGDEITLWAALFRYINPEDNFAYFVTRPDTVNVKTHFTVVKTNNQTIFAVEPEYGISMDLPTQDPHQKGYLWNDNGIVKISLG